MKKKKILGICLLTCLSVGVLGGCTTKKVNTNAKVEGEVNVEDSSLNSNESEDNFFTVSEVKSEFKECEEDHPKEDGCFEHFKWGNTKIDYHGYLGTYEVYAENVDGGDLYLSDVDADKHFKIHFNGDSNQLKVDNESSRAEIFGDMILDEMFALNKGGNFIKIDLSGSKPNVIKIDKDTNFDSIVTMVYEADTVSPKGVILNKENSIYYYDMKSETIDKFDNYETSEGKTVELKDVLNFKDMEVGCYFELMKDDKGVEKQVLNFHHTDDEKHGVQILMVSVEDENGTKKLVEVPSVG